MIPADVRTGFMCRHTRTSGFKLAIVVGYPSSAYVDKLRVRYWRAASRVWTQPVLVDRDSLTGLNESDYAKHARTIKLAAEAATVRAWS